MTRLGVVKLALTFASAISIAMTAHCMSGGEVLIDGIVWEYDVEDGSAILTSAHVDDDEFSPLSGAITIPNTLDGYPVTKLDNYLFYNHTGLTSVVIQSNMKKIGRDAFRGLTNLESVKLPRNLENIFTFAFYECKALKSVSIPNDVVDISYGAFARCEALEQVEIPSGVKTIGICAFAYCYSLTRVDIPASLLQKDDGSVSWTPTFDKVFEGSPVAEVVIHEGVTKFGEPVRDIGDEALAYHDGLTSVKIVLSGNIGANAFCGCSALKSATMSDGVKSIGEGAFQDCCELASVNIPSGVTNIGSCAFSGCANLTKIEVAGGNAHYSSRGGVLYDKSGTTLVCCPGGLTSVTIPEGVAKVGESAFSGCNGLVSVKIPSGVREIGLSAFSPCQGLVEIEVAGGNAHYSSRDGVLYDKSGTTLVCCPGGLTSLEIPEGVTRVCASAFYGCISLTSVKIPSSMTSIGPEAFAGCDGLTSVDIPSSVVSIGERAFYGCWGLESVMISDGVKSIGEGAFSWCWGLSEATIPPSVTSIGEGAFDWLSTVYVAKGDAERVSALLAKSGMDVTDVEFVELQDAPRIEGDAGATVTGDVKSGFVIRPSVGVEDVVVTFPTWTEAKKVTVVVTPAVKTIRTNGAKVVVKSGVNDITGYLDLPDADFIDLANVKVKESVVKEALTGEGAEVVLDAANPKITTAATKPGLVYTFREGRTLEIISVKSPDATKIGDGKTWTPTIGLRGGDSAFYEIKVCK